MSRFTINYDNLEKDLNKKSYKVNEVAHKIEKVAFDVVRFKDADSGADLWKIQEENGEQYIVALYNNEEVEKHAWEIGKTANQLQFYYKGTPIVRVAYNKLGINKKEVDQAIEYLPYKLAESKKLVSALLGELDESAKKDVLNRYPELS